jgi:hypothetical protein
MPMPDAPQENEDAGGLGTTRALISDTDRDVTREKVSVHIKSRILELTIRSSADYTMATKCYKAFYRDQR